MWKKAVKAAAFVLIFCLLFYAVSSALVSTGDYRNYQWVRGFYAEKRDTLDAVYIGSSTCYAYWNPLVGWNDFGIAVYPYSTNAQHFIATEYLIREVRKTQPNALIIVNTNTIDESRMTVVKQHNLLDYMPFSLNKLRLTKYLSDTAGFTQDERLELYFPMYRYHSRWNELRFSDFNYRLDGMKGVSSYSTYLNTASDLSVLYTYAEGKEELPGYVLEAAESLLDYCEKEQVRILFVTVPRVESPARIRQIHTLNAMIEERGFDVLNLLDHPDLLGLDLTQDFYNQGHTNIHGSLKYTRFLSQYIMEHFGMTDKRGDPRFISWDKAYVRYTPVLRSYTLDIERTPARRTEALEMPEQVSVMAKNGVPQIIWSPVIGAEGYLVYRKTGDEAWELAGDVPEPVMTDSTTGIEDFVYTVVPYRGIGEERVYGRFDYHCVSLIVE